MGRLVPARAPELGNRKAERLPDRALKQRQARDTQSPSHQGHPPMGSQAPQRWTPFHSGCEHTQNDKEINASWLLHSADVAR